MEECYFPANLKRKDLEEVNHDFSDFSLSSPPTKMRRLDAELPQIIEEEEMANPVAFGQPEPSQTIDDLSGILPVNEERAIVLYDPAPLLQTRSPFTISVNSDFLSGFKNPVFWSNRSHPLEYLNAIKEKQENSDDQNNGSLAVVPWVPMHSQHQSMAEAEIPRTEEVSEMMDADDMEAMAMDVEDVNNSQRIHINGLGSVSGVEGANQWQQHCMIPQAAHSLSAPVAWSGTGV
ncbi:hypothetical protein HanRHA438_Chr03g0109421 [Helianthus annuus]|uniref:Uncharacterized protein n=1 Tax=Helianthus annuus TaxID=4232 RepID=A0A251V6V1_HELAN|nr:uncharacterized protein LOC110928997 [Helianthus annuus]KAF5813447.1 hypothetical protein HanXRQr2_Chr03g0098441 [Helianthus annuus]KAJ0599665.1 hypothetical protein HanIR_Chr03g0107411 [Helianthus annuus]KAJ0607172.1 hypothetical protein HanHA89_Chr03g0093401 [Helianthus annuus]KAJ0638766.1 hypothetical protein HanHA300_Chr00c0048g0699441 [Helianthus annuus]KAJ0767231.1 hypothetical protein HanLR1_Chr03g0086691 [Helianthus annuus]